MDVESIDDAVMSSSQINESGDNGDAVDDDNDDDDDAEDDKRWQYCDAEVSYKRPHQGLCDYPTTR